MRIDNIAYRVRVSVGVACPSLSPARWLATSCSEKPSSRHSLQQVMPPLDSQHYCLQRTQRLTAGFWRGHSSQQRAV